MLNSQTQSSKNLNKQSLYNDNTQSSLSHYLKDISNYTLLSFDEEKDLSKQIKDGNMDALEKLINSNLRLVIKIASYFARTGYNLDDLIQEGNIGLMRAAQKYDHNKNVRFATYASQWIKQTIIRSLQKDTPVKLPYRKEYMIKKLNNTSREFMEEHQREPELHEIANKIDVSVLILKQAKKYKISVVPLNYKTPDGAEFNIENITPSTADNPLDSLLKKDLTSEMNKALNTLSYQEKTIVQYRFGLGKQQKQTLKTIGEKFGISQESVRQIVSNSLKKLKANYVYLEEYITR